MASEAVRPNYVTVWVWLVALGIMSVLASLVLPRAAAIALIFGLAAVKALLVALNYMHLRSEHLLIHAMAIVPVVLVVGLMLLLLPDLVFHH